MDYSLFRASLITCSTGALASSFKIASTTFCEGACANPSIVRAATASSCTCALAADNRQDRLCQPLRKPFHRS